MGSTDRTPEVIAALADPRIRSFRHCRSRGVAAARNTALANSRGKYIAFLDDDDEYLPTKIERQVQVFDSVSAEVGMVYVWCSYVGSTGETVGALCPSAEGYVFLEALKLRLTLGIGSTSMIRSTVIDTVGSFDESLFRAADIDFLCRLSKHYNLVRIPEMLTRLHIGHPQMSARTMETLADRRDYVLRHQALYRDELAKRPRTRSSLWRRLAVAELRVCNYGGAFRAVVAAFFSDPTTGLLAVKWLAKSTFQKLSGTSGVTTGLTGVAVPADTPT